MVLFRNVRRHNFILICFLVAQLISAAAGQAQASDYAKLSIEGKVTEAAGTPVPGARVWINRLTGAAVRQMQGLEAITDGDGKYRILVEFNKDQKIAIAEIFADAVGFVRAAGSISESPGGETRSHSFVLEKGEAIQGRISLPDHDRSPAKYLLVEGPALTSLPINGRIFSVQTNGMFSIDLPKGHYNFQLWGGSRQFSWNRIPAPSSNLVLRVPAFAWNPANLEKEFDGFWQAMDTSYSYFFLKTNVNWAAAREKFRPRAAQAKDARELAAVLQEMLTPLQDLHIWVLAGSEHLPTGKGGYTYNGNKRVVMESLEHVVECGSYCRIGKTKADGFGYFLLHRQAEATPALVAKALQTLQTCSDVPGFIVDLRTANGGSEPMAQQIAAFFCARPTVYALSKYRNGLRHTDFGKSHKRVLPSSTQAFTKPVVCLIGPGAVSSGEGFIKMMACLSHVTTVGMPTRGASGNPGAYPLGETGVTVYFSRWVDMMPNGETFEGRGISPQVKLDLPAEAYAEEDPTLEKGLEILRQKTKSPEK